MIGDNVFCCVLGGLVHYFNMLSILLKHRFLETKVERILGIASVYIVLGLKSSDA